MARAERTGTRPFQKKDRPWKRGSDGNAFRLRQRSVLDLDCGRHVGGSGHSSSDAPFVPVMKTAEPGQRDHLRIIGRPWLNGTTGGSLLAQIVVGPVVMVVGEVFLEDASQMAFVQDDHVVQALPSDGSDEALDVGRLPGTSEGDQKLFNAHVVDAVLEDIAIDSVSVSEQVFRRGVPGKRLDDLLSRPLGGGTAIRVNGVWGVD